MLKNDSMPEPGARLMAFVEAIREALELAMEADQRVIVVGEGVPDPKAIFTSTAGLQERFGSARVFDMPLAENGMTGICIGAALSGLRPVMVHQRIDFALLAMDQLINNAAKWFYMFDGQARVPLVVRLLIGRGWGQGPQHSQSLQAMFAMVPGLKVVMPVTSYDAKGMLLAAIEDDNPVLFIEHRWLHHVQDHVPEGRYLAPLGVARVLAEGDHVTVAAFSYMVLEALKAAKALADHGIHVEVIDMRSVRPLDVTTVVESINKTGHLVVVDTAHRTGGIAGELIAECVETAFDRLKARPVRVTSPDYPTPTSQYMTAQYYPDAQRIADSALRLLDIDLQSIDYGGLCGSLRNSGRHDIPNSEFSGPF